MSVVPRRWPLPAPQVAEAVAAMYCGKRERPLPVVVRNKLGEWLADEQFAGAYGVRGKPGWPPSRLALVTVLQMAEDLTNRQAAECVRARIDWKYALGLDLADPGFDHSVLSEFRPGSPAGVWIRWCWTRCWSGWPLAGWWARAPRCAPIPPA
jgi:hypothetical protein